MGVESQRLALVALLTASLELYLRRYSENRHCIGFRSSREVRMDSPGRLFIVVCAFSLWLSHYGRRAARLLTRSPLHLIEPES